LGGFISDATLRKTCSLTLARKIPIVGGMLLSMAIIGCNYVDGQALVVGLMALAFFGKGIGALGWAVVSDTSPKEAGGVSGGLFNTFGNLSSITTPIVIGYILSATNSFNGALVFVGLNALVAAFAYLFIVGRIQRMRDGQHHGQDRPRLAGADDEADQARRQVRHDADARGDHLAGHHVRQARDHPHQVAAAAGISARKAAQQPPQPAQQDALGHPVGQASGDQQRRDHQRQVGAGIGFQCVLQPFQPLYRHHRVHHRLSPVCFVVAKVAGQRPALPGLSANGRHDRVSPARVR
ncbi:MAG: MFS transporter, partial [Anaerococcus vaginalis]|nr:MFS transporter [Anaerococcus vaginalis]